MQNNNNAKHSSTYDKIYSLYKVIGIGSKDNFSISCNKVNGLTAWITGPYVVIYDIKKDKQIKFIKNKNNKTFACLSFSQDGLFLACGEGNCKNGEILIFEMSNDENVNEENKMKTIKSHKHGIEKIKFFKNDKYLISIGDSDDKNIFISNTQTGDTIFSSKYNRTIFGFDICDSFMILGGDKFLKLWNIDEIENKKLVINKNNIDMGKLKDKVFFSAAIYNNENYPDKKAFLITSDGHLLEVKCSTKQITRWMHLKTDKGLSICLNDANVICGCGDGIIRVFKIETFEHVMTLHRPPPLGKANIDSNIKKINISVSQDEKFADIIIVSFNNIHDRLISIYSDKTFFIWDIKKTEKIYVYRYNSFHSGSINNMDIQSNDDDILKIVTCSDDKTVKLWNFKFEEFGVQNSYFLNPRKIQHIAYSKILRRIFYFGKGFNHFKFDIDGYIQNSGKINNNNLNLNNVNYIADDLEDIEIFTVKFSPDYQYLIFGDNIGNIYIYSLTNFERVNYASVHNAQITCIDIIRKDKLYLLATGSMDNLMTVFDISPGLHKEFENFERNVIEDHQAPVTNLLFCVDRLNNLKLVSCSADRSINFYLVHSSGSIQLLQRFQEDDINTYCLAFNPINKQIIAGHNGKLTIWKSKIFTCQKIFQMKRGENYLDNFRIAVDKTGTIIAISNNDKYIRIRSILDGHLFTKIPIAESVSSLHFAINNSFLIASSVEGYIYFFKIDLNSISVPILKEIEEKKKIKNKLKLLERFLQNDSSKNKHEKVKALIEKIQNSEEEFNFEDVKLLNSYFDEKEKLTKENNNNINENNNEPIEDVINFAEKIEMNPNSNPLEGQEILNKIISKNGNSAVIEIKEDKLNNENDEDNNNNKEVSNDLVIQQDNPIKNSFLTKSNIFEKNLKELPGEALKKSILNKSRISLTETYLKMKENKGESNPLKANFVENIFKKAEKLPLDIDNKSIIESISARCKMEIENIVAPLSVGESEKKTIITPIRNTSDHNIVKGLYENNKEKENENVKEKPTEKEKEITTPTENPSSNNYNNIITSNFFNKKNLQSNYHSTPHVPIELKDKKFPNNNIQRKNNIKEREFTVTNSELNELQQIISNTNKLVGDIHTRVYNTNENNKNKKEEREDDYDYFSNDDRFSIIGIKEPDYRMFNHIKAGNIFKKNLQDEASSVNKDEMESEEIKKKNKFNNIRLDENMKDKNSLYEIAEELQFEDMNEMSTTKIQTNIDVSDSLMNKDKFQPSIIENTLLNSQMNLNPQISQTETFTNELFKEYNTFGDANKTVGNFTLGNVTNVQAFSKMTDKLNKINAKNVIFEKVDENNFFIEGNKKVDVEISIDKIDPNLQKSFSMDSLVKQFLFAESYVDSTSNEDENLIEIKR